MGELCSEEPFVAGGELVSTSVLSSLGISTVLLPFSPTELRLLVLKIEIGNVNVSGI